MVRKKCFSEDFFVCLRGEKEKPCGEKIIRKHSLKFSDFENKVFWETVYSMDHILHRGSRLWSGFDLCLFRIKANENFNYLEFFSNKAPTLKIGEILHLCHYYHPNNPGDPFLLVNRIEVVGFAQTNIGL